MNRTLWSFGLLLILCTTFQWISAQEGNYHVKLDASIGITIPQSYTTTPLQGTKWAGVRDNDPSLYAMISTLDVTKFDKDKVLNQMDTIVFNLKNYTLTDSENESFWDLSRDYKIKRYVSNTDSTQRVMTFTFYSYKHPYVLLGNYHDDQSYKKLEELTQGVSISEVGGWKQLWVYWKFARGTLLLLTFGTILLSIILRKITGRKLSCIIPMGIVLAFSLYSMWGYPIAIITTMSVLTITVIMIMHVSNDGSSGNSGGDDVDVDIDFDF